MKTLTPRWLPASLLPKALGSATLRFSRTRPNNASHDITGVVWARVISGTPRIRYSFPFTLAYTFVEADTITSPVVGAVSPDRSKAQGGEGKEGEVGGNDGFHVAWFGWCYVKRALLVTGREKGMVAYCFSEFAMLVDRSVSANIYIYIFRLA